MQMSIIERKVLSALLVICKPEGYTKITQMEVAKAMGYKKGGGAISFALKALEFKNYIDTIKSDKGILSARVLI